VVLLARAVERLGWADRVAVVHARAEDLARTSDHRERYDLVTARSFGPPAVTAECGGAFVRVGGLLAVTGPPGDDGARWPDAPLAKLGLAKATPDRADVDRPGEALAAPPVHDPEQIRVQLLSRTRPLDDRFPRRPGIPSKRPLY
jgi:16S rRNA (guanine527-N7)-methyltransferase